MACDHAALTNNSPGTRWGFSLKGGISGIIGIFSNPKGKTVSDIFHIRAEKYPIYSTNRVWSSKEHMRGRSILKRYRRAHR